MRLVSRPAFLAILLTLALLSLVAAVLACAPTAPDTQADPPEPTAAPTPSPTPDVFYAYINNTRVPFHRPPPLPTPPNDKVEYGLRGQAFRYQEKLDEQRSRGITPDDPPPTADVHISIVPGSERTAAKMLTASGATLVRYSPASTLREYTRFTAEIPVTIILDLQYYDYIIRVRRIRPPSFLGPTSSVPMQSTMVDFIAQFHQAGYTGAGVEIGIIDAGFQGFSQITRPPNSPAPTALCFRDTRSPIPFLPDRTETTNEIADCETDYPHGTLLASRVLEVVPDATLYLAKARDRDEIKQAVDWMTAKTLDNDDRQQAYPYDFGFDTLYDTAQNDEYNVRLIVFSLGYEFDGPGDGNSDVREPYSPILSADKAIENGAIWFSAAGNYGTRTWFSRAPTYRDNVLDFDPTDNHESCNDLTVLVAETTEIQLRWSGTWGGPNHDLDLILYEVGDDGTPMKFVTDSAITQSGTTDSNPSEEIAYGPVTEDATYCIMVKRRSATDEPAWVQLQVREPGLSDLSIANATPPFASMTNPAESDNPHLISVGAVNPTTTTVYGSSSRGPIPSRATAPIVSAEHRHEQHQPGNQQSRSTRCRHRGPVDEQVPPLLQRRHHLLPHHQRQPARQSRSQQ